MAKEVKGALALTRRIVRIREAALPSPRGASRRRRGEAHGIPRDMHAAPMSMVAPSGECEANGHIIGMDTGGPIRNSHDGTAKG